MNEFISTIETQVGLTSKYIDVKNTPDTSSLLIQTVKNSKDYSQSYNNFEVIGKFFGLTYRSHNYDLSKIYDAIINKKLKSFLLSNYQHEFSAIDNDNLKSYTYCKRIYNLLSTLTCVSNISLLEFYKNRKEEIDENVQLFRSKSNAWYLAGDLFRSEAGKGLKTLIDDFGKCQRESSDQVLTDCVNSAINDIIEIIDTDYYVEAEFDNNSNILIAVLSLLLDYLASTDNKKAIYNLLDNMHRISNRKNKMFYDVAYERTVKSNKPVILFTNNPKLLYYYLNFYKIKYRGRFLKKILKHNILDLLLCDIKLFNNTTVNLTKYMPKFEAFFNKHKDKNTYSLSTFVQADTVINNAKNSVVLDILEQNMEVLYTMVNGILVSDSKGMSYYWRSDNKTYSMEDVNIFKSLKKISIDTKRFWEIIENLLLNFKFSYKQKLKVLKLLKDNEINGFDEFAANAPFELQPLICEMYIS